MIKNRPRRAAIIVFIIHSCIVALFALICILLANTNSTEDVEIFIWSMIPLLIIDIPLWPLTYYLARFCYEPSYAFLFFAACFIFGGALYSAIGYGIARFVVYLRR